MYSVFIRPKAEKYLNQIEPVFREKLKTAIKFLAYEPIPFRQYDVKKIRDMDDTYRIRIGRFRFIYTIYEGQRLIGVTKIERRDETTYDF